jgi:choline dehydrogenase-like flavoprotein
MEIKYLIKGKIQNPEGKPVSGIKVNAYDKDFPFDKHSLGSTASDEKGLFEMQFTESKFKHLFTRRDPDVFLEIVDDTKAFRFVRDKISDYNKKIQNDIALWTSSTLGNVNEINNYTITVIKEPRTIPDKYDAVVIGSGFGGTIVSLTLANFFYNKNKRVCLLERGQWWISHEMPTTFEGTINPIPQNSTIRQYLEENNIPYSFWAYPDNLKGLLALFGNTRETNGIKGLYDYKVMQNVHAVTSSGVGGGSLVYFNITERPYETVYGGWETERTDKPLKRKYTYKEIYDVNAVNYVASPDQINDPNYGIDYFDIAANFIGVNKISTTAGLGKFRLPRSRSFQDAAQKIKTIKDNILNESKKDIDGNIIRDQNGNELTDFDVNLSITDVPDGLMALQKSTDPTHTSPAIKHPTVPEVNQYFQKQTNVCQRQGRCGLGCIPGARHSLNKQIHNAIKAKMPIDVIPLCQVDTIEVTGNSEYRYRVNLKDYRDDNNNGIPRTIETNLVVLAAGTLGSTEILWRSKKQNKLDISDAIGTHFSTNGDTFGVIHPTKENVDSSRGPMQTSIAKFKCDNTGQFSFSIEDLGIPKMFGEILPVMFKIMAIEKELGNLFPNQNIRDMFTKVIFNKIKNQNSRNDLMKLARSYDISMFGITTDRITRIIEDIYNTFLDSKTRIQSPEERCRNVMMLFGVGVDNSDGELFLDNDGQINLKNPYNLDKPSQPVIYAIIDMMKEFANQIGQNNTDSLFIPFWSKDDNDKNNKTQITAHPLGGCPIGKDASTGVVDSFGNVYRSSKNQETYDGLYVVDGSVIPSALGVNPSLTISALAFRSAEYITNRLMTNGDSKQFWPR